MENIKYPYRFKTEKEFIKEFGHNWRQTITKDGLPNWADDGMQHLFGKPFPFTENQLNKSSFNPLSFNNRWYDSYSGYDWLVSWKMLIKNELLPDYNPKQKVKRTL